MFKRFFKKYTYKSGMTIIELIVVILLFVITASITIFNYSGYRTNISLENLAQDIALNIRRAQVYAIGVRGISSGGTAQFNGYGMRFSTSTSASPTKGNEKAFVFFTDFLPSNFKYDQDPNTNVCGTMYLMPFSNECIEVMNITSTDKITQFCVNGTLCMTQTQAPVLDIVFTRPNPEARFYLTLNGALYGGLISSVDIIVEALSGTKKTITVWNTGQISVK